MINGESIHENVVTDTTFQSLVLESGCLVLVEFWAEWCGVCDINAPLLEEFARHYKESLTVCRIDVDENPELPERYGVRDVPTLLLFKDGRVTDYIVGLIPRGKLTHKIEAALSGARKRNEEKHDKIGGSTE